MSSDRRNRRNALLGATALAGALALAVSPAAAQQQRHYEFNLPSQSLNSALRAYGATADQQLIFADADIDGRTAPALKGSYTADDALRLLLAETGLYVRRTDFNVLQISATPDPQPGSAAGDGADGTVEALIVTAQKREEDIQDVPIAISAFTQEDLTRSQVAGGPDLMTQVPNFTFTKTNFSGYSIQIRGIGTQAISATTDPAVAVAFNNTPFIRNRFFEQEFYDLQRVEVLRGPQGTLYGRNATAGVVNIISQKPSFNFEARAAGDVANYSSTRIEGMINIPLVEDRVALRVAGAWTKRDGYATNELTGNPIDGRDLWSTRVSLRIEPNENISANLIWEHFEEDDDRLRSGKQLCHKHTPTEIGGIAIPGESQPGYSGSVAATFTQGCLPVSMYSPEAYQTPNGFALPYYAPLAQINLPIPPYFDPYLSATQSRDLRVIESSWDPEYRARSDLGELQINVELGRDLSLASETAYSTDMIWSLQDYNRFTTAPGAWFEDNPAGARPNLLVENGTTFCDPQLGCSDRLMGVDISTAKSRQFSQELRLSSHFDGSFNFNLGANFLRYETEDKYYVLFNSLNLWVAQAYGPTSSGSLDPWVPGVTDNSGCTHDGFLPGDPTKFYTFINCVYMDPNPIGSLNDEGHNYFLSKNPYRLLSYAAFGEVYYQITPTLKLTGGLRFTVDRKNAPQIPSWLLANGSRGLPVARVYRREWREPTGRLTLDWKPDLSWSEETLVYGSYAHGYKAGGSNPPPAMIVVWSPDTGAPLQQQSLAAPQTFEGEFVEAFELGSKNTLLDGRLTVNATTFYYDYEGYQISQIVNRSALNINVDAEVWGAEIEADWRPLENLRLGFKGGYENTRIADGTELIDLMDRTAGKPGWVVARPFPSVPSNCILPVSVVTVGGTVNVPFGDTGLPGPCVHAYAMGLDPVTLQPYMADPPSHPGYPGFNPLTAPNNGEGFTKDVGGNELPNAPQFTATLTGDYTIPFGGDWLATLHTDFYYQAEAWGRVFNTEGYDKIKAYTNVNLAAIFSNEDAGWKVMAYVKNVFDRTAITGTFLNSDDTGLTTNVFLNEPRLYGLRVTKEWTGTAPWANGLRSADSFPLWVELGGAAQRHEGEYADIDEPFMDEFSPALAPTEALNRDLDWGDGREMRLTYKPQNSPWRVSGGVRYGKANGLDKVEGSEVVPACIKYQTQCDADPFFRLYPTNYSRSTIRNDEDHVMADFMVGYDVGLGSSGLDARLSAGVRYAEFESSTRAVIGGVPNWVVAPENSLFQNSTHDRFAAELQMDRSFSGAGPALALDLGRDLVGNDEDGRLSLEASLDGAVLFGKQKSAVEGEVEQEHWDGLYGYFFTILVPPTSTDTTPVSASRSESVSVPVLGGSLGLSYAIDRFKISAGYRIEKAFDVIDAGYDANQQYDRTIDGPYFKLSVGFGG